MAIRALERDRGVRPARIIAVSANTAAEDKEDARAAGIDEYGAVMRREAESNGRVVLGQACSCRLRLIKAADCFLLPCARSPARHAALRCSDQAGDLA